jgi:O-antigen/teichoic acid export membrane protein
VYALGGVVSQGLAFLLFPFLTRVFTPRDYGIIDLVGLVTTLANLTIPLEVSEALGRYYSETENDDERRAYASTALVFTVTMFTTALAVSLVLVRPLTDVVLGRSVPSSTMAVALVAMWSSGMLYLSQGLLRWQLRPRAFTVVTLSTGVVATGVTATLVFGFGVGVVGALIGQLSAFTVSGALAFWFSRRLFVFSFDASKLRRMLAYSIPLLPGSVGVFLNLYADRLVIRSRLGLSDVGVYGVAYRLSIVVSLTLLGFQGALMPLVLSGHSNERTRRELAQVFRLFCAGALAIFLYLSVFADDFVRVLTRPAYYGAGRIVPILVAASFLAGMAIFAPGLNIAKRTGSYAVVTATFGLVNVGLAFALVGPLGIRGPALAFLVTCAGSFATVMVLSQRAYPVPHQWARLLLVAGGVTALVVLARIRLAGTDDLGVVLGKAAVAAAGTATISFVLVSRSEWRELAQSLRRRARAPRS